MATIIEKIEGKIAEELNGININRYANAIMKRLQECASTRWRELITPESQDEWLADFPGAGLVQRVMHGAHIQVGEHNYVMAWVPHTLKCVVVRDGVPFEPANPTLVGPERDREVKVLAEKQLRKDLKPVIEKVIHWLKVRKIRMVYMDHGTPMITVVRVDLNETEEQQYSWFTAIPGSDDGWRHGPFDGKEAVENFLCQYIDEKDPLFMSCISACYKPDNESYERTYYTWLVQREEQTLAALSNEMPDCYFVGANKEVVA